MGIHKNSGNVVRGRGLLAIMPLVLMAVISLATSIIFSVLAWHAPLETVQDTPHWFGALASIAVLFISVSVIVQRLRQE